MRGFVDYPHDAIEKGMYMAETAEHLLLEGLLSVIEAPFRDMARQFSRLVHSVLPHSAVLMLSESLIGPQQSLAGRRSIIEGVHTADLDELRPQLAPNSTLRHRVEVAKRERSVLLIKASTGALALLTDPGDFEAPGAAEHFAADALILRLWNIVALQVQHETTTAPPYYLLESRAVSSARAEAITELTDQHTMNLETLLLTLRSSSLDDRSARSAATSIATSALIRLQAASERVRQASEESVTTAFIQLKDDLGQLVKYSGIDMQFVDPPADGRALPTEVAYGARAVVQSAILALLEQAAVTRLRVQWDCDGKNLIIDIRDNGPGDISHDAARLQPLERRVHALSGSLAVTGTSGWGSEMSVVLPLDPPPPPGGAAMEWGLAPRELQVLAQLASGRRNRDIARELGISENTVKFHVSKILRKLGVRTRGEAAAQALEKRILAYV